MEARSQIDECVHGDLAGRGTADQTDDIDLFLHRVMCCRLDEMTFFFVSIVRRICLFTGVDIPIWTLVLVQQQLLSHRSATSYNMTKHGKELEKKKKKLEWRSRVAAVTGACLFNHPDRAGVSTRAEIEMREWKEFIAFPAVAVFIDVSAVYCYR
jgi:hypothetical protein